MAASSSSSARAIPLFSLLANQERLRQERPAEFPVMQEAMIYVHREYQDLLRAVKEGKGLPRSAVYEALELAGVCLKLASDLGDETMIQALVKELTDKVGIKIAEDRKRAARRSQVTSRSGTSKLMSSGIG